MGRTEIEHAAEELLESHGSFSSAELSERTGLSRQALHRHLSRWVGEGRLVQEGRGRATRYRRPDSSSFERAYRIAGLAEDEVWSELETWIDASGVERSPRFDAVLAYVATELVNNAIEHSGAPTVTVRARYDGRRIHTSIADEGIGALESIRSRLGLEDHLHAFQELSKGKVTTMPERHTGAGLFFSSKMVDQFELAANGLLWIVDNERADHAVRSIEERSGTEVRVDLSLRTTTTPEGVLARYTHDFEFDTTRCVVRLFEYGVRFVSRSEAKRLVSGLDEFREVILDFRGVESVGQGFADEIFRVWGKAHPEVRLRTEHMVPTVEFMVERARRG